jgi:hypothetical protein
MAYWEMYSTCLFCNGSLGENTAIERFPVGQRLAFDPAKGRLWVICRRCERWNLSPMEERWEAIEDCERRFRATRLRMSTANIGLTRLPEGLELVRIGAPQRPEFAAWRYGDQFGRRRRRKFIRIGVGTTVVGGLAAGFFSIGAATGGGLWLLARLGESAYERIVHGSPRDVVATVPLESGARIPLRRVDLGKVGFAAEPFEGFRLTVPVASTLATLRGESGFEVFKGEKALRAAGMLLPAMNWAGATKEEVASATTLVDDAASAHGLFDLIARRSPGPALLHKLDTPLRLALEMASHEESERRALEGELVLLEAAWRDAEEIAGIADNLLLPPGIEERVKRDRPT